MEKHDRSCRGVDGYGIGEVDGPGRHLEAVANAQVLDVVLVACREHLDRAVALAAGVEGEGRGDDLLRVVVVAVVGVVVVHGEPVVVLGCAEEVDVVQRRNRLLVVQLLLHENRLVIHEFGHRLEETVVAGCFGKLQGEVDDRLDLAHHHRAVRLAADVEATTLARVGERRVDDEL